MFLLNLQSKLPINEQIQAEILRFITAGVLRPGEKLPSVRQLAAENGINPNTVARAYAELEKQGAVYNIPKKGVYVAERTGPKPDMVTDSLRRIRDSGVSKQELLNKVEAVYGEEYDVKS